MKKRSANTRTVTKPNYAVITEDSYVESKIPGWVDTNVRVVISPSLGAKFSQLIIQLTPKSIITDITVKSQIFFFVVEGTCKIHIEEGETKTLSKGEYVYIPVGKKYRIDESEGKLVSFQKEYQPLEGVDLPEVFFGNSHQLENEMYLNDDQLYMKYLLADDISMDFAVNIFTYQPGGNLPFVETHIMEHGLLFLSGEGIYRLENDWYHLGEGDVIWMGPYCQQWFGAIGKQDAVYIYCKDVNRHSMDR